MSETLLKLVTAAAGLAKAGFELAQTSDAAKRNAQLTEFQQAIIQMNMLLATIQNENAGLISDKQALEEKIARMKDWEIEKKRYKMASPSSGAIVFALQKAMSNGQPPHYLCTRCYNEGIPSIMQLAKIDKDHSTAFVCPKCDTKALTGFRGSANPKYVEEIEA